MAFLGSSRAAGRLMVLLQMALFVIVSALIMNSSLCLAAAGQDDIAGMALPWPGETWQVGE
ncbi:hypothetical protein TRIUR3_01632 [Triticum urartu]|uniref:Uncharacterized protein n=1 Tax=Triticum urartu TaxID=4572 RepID=M7YNB1_TRIUA|nr:hypothetical protein TRIUR3_01632 [Triticum urartu]